MSVPRPRAAGASRVSCTTTIRSDPPHRPARSRTRVDQLPGSVGIARRRQDRECSGRAPGSGISSRDAQHELLHRASDGADGGAALSPTVRWVDDTISAVNRELDRLTGASCMAANGEDSAAPCGRMLSYRTYWLRSAVGTRDISRPERLDTVERRSERFEGDQEFRSPYGPSSLSRILRLIWLLVGAGEPDFFGR